MTPRPDHGNEPVRVLLVDDDKDLSETICMALEGEGYRVLAAPDGLVALHLLRHVSYPVVVVTDHQMPRLDGLGLMAMVLADPELRKRTAFISMTAASRAIPPADGCAAPRAAGTCPAQAVRPPGVSRRGGRGRQASAPRSRRGWPDPYRVAAMGL